MYVFAVSVATLFAISEVLNTFNIQIDGLNSFLTLLPLYENGLGWTGPTLMAAVIGYVIDFKSKEVVFRSKS